MSPAQPLDRLIEEALALKVHEELHEQSDGRLQLVRQFKVSCDRASLEQALRRHWRKGDTAYIKRFPDGILVRLTNEPPT